MFTASLVVNVGVLVPLCSFIFIDVEALCSHRGVGETWGDTTEIDKFQSINWEVRA